MSELKELRNRLEIEFADLLAPDLAANGASRIHVVLTSETDLVTCGAFTALTSPRLWRWLEPFTQKWNGPAPCLLIDGATISSDCGGHLPSMLERFIAVVTHEVGHIASVPGLFEPVDPLIDEHAELARQFFVASVADRSMFYQGSSPRDGHGYEWIRACIHLTHRMRQRGWNVWLPGVIDREFYGYSSTSIYSRALGDECRRLEDIPLTSLQYIPAPAAFIDQWNADLAQWPDGEF